MSCDEMVNSVIQKINSRLKFLYRKRNFLNEHTKNILVSSLIQCHFDYACSFSSIVLQKGWKTSCKSLKTKW